MRAWHKHKKSNGTKSKFWLLEIGLLQKNYAGDEAGKTE